MVTASPFLDKLMNNSGQICENLMINKQQIGRKTGAKTPQTGAKTRKRAQTGKLKIYETLVSGPKPSNS